MAKTPQERPRATYRQAARMLRPHTTQLAAIALAADEACAQLCASLYKDAPSIRYDRKTRGLLVAVLWSEGVREWVLATQPPGVRLFSPFGWTELVLYDNLHVRVERDQGYPVSERRRMRRQQFVDDLLPFPVKEAGPYAVTNVDLVARLSPYGRISGAAAHARMGKGQLWRPRQIDLAPARRMVRSWQRREVPWLATAERAAVLAQVDDLLRERDELLAEIERLNELLERPLLSQNAGARLIGTEPDQERRPMWTGSPKASEASGDGEGS